MKKIHLTPSSNLPSRPVALVTVCDLEGKPNIITVGSVYYLTLRPPLVGIGIKPERYSYELLEQVPEFVINYPSKELVWETDFCGTCGSGSKIDKFEVTKLTPEKAQKVKPPIIKECKVHFECVNKQKLVLGDSKQHVQFIGEVVNVSVDESILNDKKRIDWRKVDFINFNSWTYEYYSYLGDLLGNDGLAKTNSKK
ncbi:MAG: flavin reductase family protein [Candidatus Ranarchaeia archaeon]